MAGRLLALRVCLGQMVVSLVHGRTGCWQDTFAVMGPGVQKSLEQQPKPLGIEGTETWLLPAAEQAAFGALVWPCSSTCLVSRLPVLQCCLVQQCHWIAVRYWNQAERVCVGRIVNVMYVHDVQRFMHGRMFGRVCVVPELRTTTLQGHVQQGWVVIWNSWVTTSEN